MARTTTERPGNGRRQEAPPPPPEVDPLAFLDADADSGEPDLGTSTAAEDNLVPLIYVLQPLSPQVNERDADTYIPGAKSGSIWLRNASDPIVDGDEGIIFQPCFFSKDWVEWVPRREGGGFVARHDELPEGARQVEDDENGRIVYRLDNGHEVVEVRYDMGFVHRGNARLPFVIPMTSTGHTVSKNWVFSINQRRLPNGKKCKSYMGLYRLTTKQRKNKKGVWFTFSVAEEGYISSPQDLLAAKDLQEAFRLGNKQSEQPLITHYDSGVVSDAAGSNEAVPEEEAPM